MPSTEQLASPESRTGAFRVGSVARLIGWIVGVTASLLAFPAVLPWMILAWILFAITRMLQCKSAAAPLFVGSLICAIKLPELTIAFAVLIAGMSCAGFIVRRGKQAWRRNVLVAALLVIAWIGYFWSFVAGATTSRALAPDGRAIVCLGDSLTDFGYPDVLRELVLPPVLDFGVSGINSTDGLKMVPEIIAANPQLVIIELGGHDYNQGRGRQSTKRNLSALIEQLRGESIEVLLMEIPRGFVTDPYYGLERELARKYDLQLIADSVIREFVLFSPICPPGMWLGPESHLSRDGLHPNERGNRRLAEIVANSLHEIYGTADH